MKKFIIIFGFAFFTLLFANQSFAQTTGATVKLWDSSREGTEVVYSANV